MADVSWEIKLYDKSGNQIADLSTHVLARKLTFKLNDVDSFTCQMYLDDTYADDVVPLETVIKVWRHVPSQGYTRPAGSPNFAGVVAGRTRYAQGNYQEVVAFSPLWRLQSRYHVDPHDFTFETGRGRSELYADGEVGWGTDPTEIMWTMIGWTNELYQGTLADDTGIIVGDITTLTGYSGSTPSVPGDPTVRGHDYDPAILLDRKYERGQNTWEMVAEIIQHPAFPDLHPEYVHVAGSHGMLKFHTTSTAGKLVRGVASNFPLDFNTGSRTLDDIVERPITDPGTFATMVVVQGQGDRAVDKTIEKADGTTRAIPYTKPTVNYTWPDLVTQYGIYMSWEKLDQAVGGGYSFSDDRRALAQDKLRRMMHPVTVYEPSISPAVLVPFQTTLTNAFDIGDTLPISCVRNAMTLASVRKRVEEVTLEMSENNFEKVGLVMVDDYYGQIV